MHAQHTQSAVKNPSYMPGGDELLQVGLILRARRARLGLSQPALADKTFEIAQGVSSQAISQRTISDIENGKQNPLALTSARLMNYVRALDWSLQDFAHETGLGAAAFITDDDPLDRFTVQLDAHAFPVYGSVSAGTSDAEPIDGEVAPIAWRQLKAAGASPENVRVFLVNGDCMVSDSVRRVRKNIAHGDYIGVNTSGMPNSQGNSVVCVYDHDADKLIIKHYKEEGEHVVLYPANGGTPMVRAVDDPELSYVGTVFWRSGNTL